jgi:tetratricopeptide (TPR) repeat protein
MFDYEDITRLTSDNTPCDKGKKIIDRLDAELKKDPDNILLLLQMGSILFEEHIDTKAIEVFNRVLQLNPYNMDAYIWLGELLLFHWADSERAIPLLEKALSINSYKAEIYYLLGCAVTDRHRHEEGIAYFKKAIALDPTLITPRGCLIDYLIEEKHYDQAAQAIQEFETYVPKNRPDPKNDMEYYYEALITGRLRTPIEIQESIQEFKNRLAKARQSSPTPQ